MAIDALEKQIYEVFSPAPLSAAQKSTLYVDLDSVRGDADVVTLLGKSIRLSPVPATCQVLVGHKGCGKSTELMCLKSALENEDPKYFVVFLDIFENLDQNDVDFPDLLIEVVRQIALQVRERESIELKPGYLSNRVEQLREALKSEVDLSSAEFGGGLLKISAAIKSSPTARRMIRDALEPDTSNLLAAGNDLIQEATLKLAERGYAGLVVVADNLDKITVRPHVNGDCDTAEYLFVRRGAQMTGFDCHVIYTIPLSLAYSHHEADIQAIYGGHLPMVPATKIITRPPNSQRYGPGMYLFREMIEKRVAVATALSSDVFEDEAIVDELIALTGGQPTELMTLVRESIIMHGLPIQRDALERAKKEGQREYARMLRAEHWPIIEQVREAGTFGRSSANEESVRQLLNSRAILQYVNDEEWYALNPMIAGLRRP